jgi:hypothetical protein
VSKTHTTNISMGLPQTPSEPAPAYNDVWQNHPVNEHPPPGSSSAYAAVPQDDVELASQQHSCVDTPGSSTAAPQEGESLAQTIAGVFRPKQHVHCKECDVQTQARERRANERHCCAMVAATFMTAFACLTLLVIVLESLRYGYKKHHRG